VTPRGQEALVRLAAWMSFEHAGELLKELLGIEVSATSTRRYTYQTGQAALAVQQAEEDRLREELPEPPTGAERQVISADGAFVPLVGGEWAEVKTLVVAEVLQHEEGEADTSQVSSFSRLADVETFSQQAVVELHRRGVERAKAVCAVTDGAEWLQGCIDDHCPKAIRILDARACRRVCQRDGAGGHRGWRCPDAQVAGRSPLMISSTRVPSPYSSHFARCKPSIPASRC